MKVKLLFFISVLSINALFAQWSQIYYPNINTINALAINGTNIFGGSDAGVYLFAGNGSSWSQAGLTTQIVLALHRNNSQIYAGTESNGVYYTVNNGSTWNISGNSFPSGEVVTSLTYVNGTLLAGTDGVGVYKLPSSSWQYSGLNNKTITSLTIFNNQAIAGTDGDGVYSANANFTSWTAMNSGLGSTDVWSLTSSSNYLFAGTTNGVYRYSYSAGWQASNTGISGLKVTALCYTSNMLFAGTDANGVYMSSDNGVSWTAINSGLSFLSIKDLDASTSYLFAATVNGGVWRRLLSDFLATPLSITYTNTNPTCNGLSNASINLSVTGGTTPYSYLWSNNQTTEDLNNLSVGNYSVTVTSTGGTTTSASITITQPTVLSVSITASNPTCYGLNNGSINISASGGTLPYTYLWNFNEVTILLMEILLCFNQEIIL